MIAANPIACAQCTAVLEIMCPVHGTDHRAPELARETTPARSAPARPGPIDLAPSERPDVVARRVDRTRQLLAETEAENRRLKKRLRLAEAELARLQAATPVRIGRGARAARTSIAAPAPVVANPVHRPEPTSAPRAQRTLGATLAPRGSRPREVLAALQAAFPGAATIDDLSAKVGITKAHVGVVLNQLQREQRAHRVGRARWQLISTGAPS